MAVLSTNRTTYSPEPSRLCGVVVGPIGDQEVLV